MSGHVPDAVLRAFVQGTATDDLAAVAVHLDVCEACAARAARADSLTRLFASVADPLAPSTLVASVLAEAERPEPLPIVEVAIGVTLLLLAVALMSFGEDPVRLAVDLSRVIEALSRGAHASGVMTWVSLACGVVLISGSAFVVTRPAGAGVLARVWA